MKWVFLAAGAGVAFAALRRSQHRAGVLFGSLFFLVGLLVMGIAVEELHLSFAARSWPVARGVVTESRVEEVRDGDGITYRPVIRYTYTYRGKTYTSRRIWVGTRLSGSAHWARRVVRRWPEGETVRVFVRPTDPSFSVLETGFVPTAGFLLLLGLVFASVGGFFVGLAVGLPRRFAPRDALAGFLTGFGVLWMLMTSPLLVEAIARLREGSVDMPAVLGPGMFLIGLVMGSLGMIRLVQNFQGRRVEVQVPPSVPGEPVCARILLPFRTFARVRVKLSCMARISVRTHEGLSVETVPLWETHRVLSPEAFRPHPRGMEARICIPTPSHLPPSGTHPLSEATRRRLERKWERIPRILRRLLPFSPPEREDVLWVMEVRVHRRGMDAVRTVPLRMDPSA